MEMAGGTYPSGARGVPEAFSGSQVGVSDDEISADFSALCEQFDHVSQ